MSEAKTLYARLGGYDAISAVANNLVSRLMADARLGRFWANRGEDGVRREIQLLIDFLCNAAGGPVLYTGRDMKVSHKGMRITEEGLGRAPATRQRDRGPLSGCCRREGRSRGLHPKHKRRHRGSRSPPRCTILTAPTAVIFEYHERVNINATPE